MGGLRYANVETEIYLLTTQELDLTGAAALSVLQLLVITGAARPLRPRTPRRRARSTAPPGASRARGGAPARAALDGRGGGLPDGPARLAGARLAAPRRRAGGCENYRALGTTGARNALLVPATEGLANSLVIALAASADRARRSGRRWPSWSRVPRAGADSRRARRAVHAAARGLGGHGRLRLPDHPRPAAARPAQLGAADPDRAGDGRAAARRTHRGAGAPLDRRPAAPGGGVAGRRAAAGAR